DQARTAIYTLSHDPMKAAMLLLIQDQARTAIYAPSQGLKKTAIVQLSKFST
uniref:Uncharacterized protein n=1 Tax=Acrobeloides nanus TaxID=290746 RepID=A0A914DQ57_9BILA